MQALPEEQRAWPEAGPVWLGPEWLPPGLEAVLQVSQEGWQVWLQLWLEE